MNDPSMTHDESIALAYIHDEMIIKKGHNGTIQLHARADFSVIDMIF